MATIIRKDSSRELTSGRPTQPISFNFADMRGQANDYLGTVRAEAAKIVQQAHQQAEQIRRQAEVAGRKAAQEAAEKVLEEKVGKRMQTLLPALDQLIGQLNDSKAELLARWHQSAVQVASAMAARIVRRELARDPTIVLDLVTEALRMATGTAEISVHINPTDYAHLGAQINSLANTLAQLTPSQIVADSDVSPGGCRIETKYGEIDMQIESQLRRIEEELS